MLTVGKLRQGRIFTCALSLPSIFPSFSRKTRKKTQKFTPIWSKCSTIVTSDRNDRMFQLSLSTPIGCAYETFISLSPPLSLRRKIQLDTRNTGNINSARGKTRADTRRSRTKNCVSRNASARGRRLSGTLNRVSRRNFGNVLRIQRVEFISRVRRRDAICMRNYTLPVQPAASNITRVYTRTLNSAAETPYTCYHV